MSDLEPDLGLGGDGFADGSREAVARVTSGAHRRRTSHAAARQGSEGRRATHGCAPVSGSTSEPGSATGPGSSSSSASGPEPTPGPVECGARPSYGAIPGRLGVVVYPDCLVTSTYMVRVWPGRRILFLSMSFQRTRSGMGMGKRRGVMPRQGVR